MHNQNMREDRCRSLAFYPAQQRQPPSLPLVMLVVLDGSQMILPENQLQILVQE